MKRNSKKKANFYSDTLNYFDVVKLKNVGERVFLNSEEPLFIRNYKNSDVIWRYMDLSKFLYLLNAKQLFFTRLDKFQDKYEGEFPQKDFETINNSFIESYINTGYSISRKDFLNTIDGANKYEFFANCWYKGSTESYGMWKSYLKSDEGVAIKTTITNLKQSLKLRIDDAIEFGAVEYIDYNKESILNLYKSNREKGLFTPPFPGLFKRKEFEFEKEFRIIALKRNDVTERQLAYADSVLIRIDPKMLIEEIYVSPFTGTWYLDLIKSVAQKYNLNKPIIQSGLNVGPKYK